MFFACRRLRARFENHRKIALNALLARLTAPSRLEKQYFQVSERRNGSRGALEGLLKLLWDPLGSQLVPLGSTLGPPWSFGDALGSLLATLLLENSRNFAWRIGFSRISAPSGDKNLRNSAKSMLKSLRKLASSAAPRTSDSNKGAAVARSEFNNI